MPEPTLLQTILFLFWQCTWGAVQTFLGPLYMLIIGLPSLLWNLLGQSYRQKSGTHYEDFYTERWATSWGQGGIKNGNGIKAWP